MHKKHNYLYWRKKTIYGYFNNNMSIFTIIVKYNYINNQNMLKNGF